jgi:osmotically-inducible protein OsmY
MAFDIDYDYEYDYGRGRHGRGSYRDPYRRYGNQYDEPYQSRYYSGQFEEPYHSRYYSDYPVESYSRYDYGRPGRRQRYDEPYRGGYEERYNDPYYRSRHYRGAEDRGFWERAGDEVRSWFGDEGAERRRRTDEIRSGTSFVGRGPRNYRRSDERIREDVNDRLTEDYYLDAGDIEVLVQDSVVTLTGRVDTRYDKRRAIDIAESVSGVTDVTNQLRVSPGHLESATETETRSRSART